MRCLTLLACLALCPARASQYDDIRAATVAFDKHYDRFTRDLFGCPVRGDATPETCSLSAGVINYKEYSAARKAAMRLFDLEER